MAQEIRIVLNTDASGMVAGNSAGSRSLSEFVRQSQAAGKSMQALTVGAQANARSMAMLQPQITDIVTSLASGQNPLTVFVQQGGQLKDMFGGIIPALRAVGSLLTVTNIAIAGVTVGLGGYIYALIEGREQSQRFAALNTLTGNSLGLTESAFHSLAQRASASTSATVGSAREMAEAFASSGRVSGTSLESMTTAALKLQKLSGDSAQSIVGDMLDMSRGVADWAAKHNESWHFMTAAQIDHVRQLEQTGQMEEAMGVVLERMNQRLNTQASLWERIKKGFSEALDAASGAGRADTTSGQLELMQNRLYNARNGGGTAEDIAALEGGVRRLNMQLLRETEAVSTGRADADAEQAAIRRRQAMAEVTARLSGVNSEYARTIKTIQDSAKAGDITEAQRVQALTEAATKYGAGAAPGKSAQQVKEEKERAYRKMVDETLKNRPVRLADIEAKGYEDANRAAQQNMAQAAEALQRRNDQASEMGRQYLESATQINIGLIRDDAERGRAQIEQERLTAQQRIDIYSAMGADVSAAEDGLASYILARNRQLEEELKPQWQRNLDNWSDTNRLMRDAYNSTMDGLVSDGEQAWIQMGLTAKLGAKQLIDSVLTEMLRLQYRQNIAGPFSNAIASVIGSMFGDTLTVDTSGTGITAPDNSLVSNGLGGGRASGGKVFARSLHPVVERGEPEVLNTSGGTYLLTGSQSGYVTPLRSAQSAQGGGSGGGQPIVNVHNYGDSQVEASSSTGSNGEAIIDIVVRKVKGEMASDIAGGGTFSRTLSNTFGLSRKTAARG